AERSNSIRHAIALQELVQPNGRRLLRPHGLQPLFGEIEIFEVGDMLQQRLPHIEALGAARLLGKRRETILAVGRKANGEHGSTYAGLSRYAPPPDPPHAPRPPPPAAAALHGRDRRAESPPRRGRLEQPRSRSRRARLFARQPLAQPRRIPRRP